MPKLDLLGNLRLMDCLEKVPVQSDERGMPGVAFASGIHAEYAAIVYDLDKPDVLEFVRCHEQPHKDQSTVVAAAETVSVAGGVTDQSGLSMSRRDVSDCAVRRELCGCVHAAIACVFWYSGHSIVADYAHCNP